jgi:hypothetical protein
MGEAAGDCDAESNVAVWAADGAGGKVGEGLARALPQPVASAAPSKTATNRCAVTMERPEMRLTPARGAPHEGHRRDIRHGTPRASLTRVAPNLDPGRSEAT